MTSTFFPSKFRRKKYVRTTWIFRSSSLHRKKSVKTTWILRASKLRQKKYMETTTIFWSAKLHRKSTWKRHGDLSKFSLWHIDVILTSTRHQFDVVCPLGLLYHKYWQTHLNISATSRLHKRNNKKERNRMKWHTRKKN